MASLWELLPTNGWPRLAIDVVWQSTLVGILAWIVLRKIVRQPATQAWIAILAIAMAVVVPVLSSASRKRKQVVTAWSVCEGCSSSG